MVSASTSNFNVVAHGLIWFRGGSAQEPWHAYIPEVMTHFYLIGKVATPSSLPGPIGHQKTGVLSFTSRGDNTKATIDRDENLVLYRSRNPPLSVNQTKLHATIRLPFPNQVTVLRCGDKPSPAKFFIGSATGEHDVDPSRLGLVHVLSYFDVEEPIVKIDDEVVFQGTDNFHVYAEPLEDRGNHFSHLIEALTPPVDLRTTPQASQVTAPLYDQNGDGIGVGAEDQKSLVDLRGGGAKDYSRPTNCMAAFLMP